MVDRAQMLFQYSLITNATISYLLVTFSQTVCARAKGPNKIFRTLVPGSLKRARG